MIYSDFDQIPRKRYACISADPPWHHRSRSPKGQNRRSPSHHYKVMDSLDIGALPVRELSANDCHLFLWTTQPHLQEAFSVMGAWGFKYSSVHTFWVKLNPKGSDAIWLTPSMISKGMGLTTRKNVELLLLGRKGSPKRLVKNMGDIMFAARREHSRKPDETFSRIETYCTGPRLELFSREPRDGWDTFGNEAKKFSWPFTLADDRLGPPAPAPAAPLFEEA